MCPAHLLPAGRLGPTSPANKNNGWHIILGNHLGRTVTASQTQQGAGSCHSPTRGLQSQPEKKEEKQKPPTFTMTHSWSPGPSLKQEPASLWDSCSFPLLPHKMGPTQAAPPCSPGTSGSGNVVWTSTIQRGFPPGSLF